MESSKEKLVTILQEEGPDGSKYTVEKYLPDPTSYTATTTTMTDGGTSVSGHLLSSIVRDNVVQISLSWNYLEASEWTRITGMFKEDYINRVRFYDQSSGSWEIRSMYISDRNAGLWRRDEHGEVLGWTGCSIQLTEV